ncbi:2,3-dihydro-2,3-dihydroxybenzoate dehydrogenase [Evansella caseinilytica]|uniref:2,3-dihydro-2,3-dihydroxybenzoate dehydrogenase n=1 Tax=Evansella caseinilytica TaxID=1503961 RepID=A0A1H3SVA3_9BACI|nr:2,3-dihydro-2,3-dihydroxybenzoate dehydrogenase [Evansella caseinilytica]
MKGKIVLVSGAAQGIGEAVVDTFVDHGAIVAAIDRNKEKLTASALNWQRKGGEVHDFPTDVSNRAAVHAMIEKIETDIGGIDILVNVAGMIRTGPIEQFSPEDWEAVFQVNIAGVFHLSQAVSRYMISRRAGAIVTVSSNAAAVPRKHMSAYAASKAAATMFTKCLGLELAEYNIRCNIVSPGSTDTEMQRAVWTDEDGGKKVIEGSLKEYRTGIPLQKIAAPSDIADAVLFLASEQAKHITMHDLRVDGGATLGM